MNPGLALTYHLDDDRERRIELPYDVEVGRDGNPWIEGVLPGDLDNAVKVTFEYKTRDIMCLEALELETIDGSKKYKIIQV